MLLVRLLVLRRSSGCSLPVGLFVAERLSFASPRPSFISSRVLRTFRAHRGRWDFEPYGICIRQSWLEQHGVRPVRYGNSALWDELTESQRPFFQLRRSGRQRQIDWSVEREWRHVGDLDLTNLPRDAAFLFVPTVEEAKWLSSQSRWQVIALQ